MEKIIPLKKLLLNKYPDKSKKELYAMIVCGEIYVNNEKVQNPNISINAESEIKIKKNKEFVSRGGIKLQHAVTEFNIKPENKIFIDAGCSTGGFTDCLLKNKAKMVYSIDVGYNQLDYKIRTDSRVKVHERLNIVKLAHKHFTDSPDAAVMDLSFRSITGAVSHIMALIKDKWIISLIKPQFEWKNPDAEFNGIVKDKKEVLNILKDLIDEIAKENCFVANVIESPIMGRKGNNEYFFLIKNKEEISRTQILKMLHEIVLKE